MTQKITKDQKDTFIEELAACGVIKLAASKTMVSVPTIYAEMKRSDVFKKRVQLAINEGKSKLGDSTLENILEIANDLDPKRTSQRLTANLAIANWVIPGFRGEQKISGKVEHDVIVKTGIPRPDYKELTPPKDSVKIIEGEVIKSTSHGEGIPKEEKDKLKALNSGKPIDSIDKAVNNVIEKEVENDNSTK